MSCCLTNLRISVTHNATVAPYPLGGCARPRDGGRAWFASRILPCLASVTADRKHGPDIGKPLSTQNCANQHTGKLLRAQKGAKRGGGRQHSQHNSYRGVALELQNSPLRYKIALHATKLPSTLPNCAPSS
jgi:hypothetical protein